MAIHSYSQVDTPQTLDDQIDKGIALMFQKEHSQSIELLITTEAIAKKINGMNKFFGPH
ncbi:hypothetical protein ADIWIN_2231 [Winogradskyella psychrotolerans RS-3]|uniref:Uncharacterized protein n=1 Tax=Winogradskyella psychrotolerans RS-3 TaxID=641526 RepID=S7X172_9FLAO|nr:hypothetical protein [Winogradskyella psychrotolerans]EPR72759.1 hypothetical protein ADIWIN_2231 [Winogradskyella psychrotolerans RS-3]